MASASVGGDAADRLTVLTNWQTPSPLFFFCVCVCAAPICSSPCLFPACVSGFAPMSFAFFLSPTVLPSEWQTQKQNTKREKEEKKNLNKSSPLYFNPLSFFFLNGEGHLLLAAPADPSRLLAVHAQRSVPPPSFFFFDLYSSFLCWCRSACDLFLCFRWLFFFFLSAGPSPVLSINTSPFRPSLRLLFFFIFSYVMFLLSYTLRPWRHHEQFQIRWSYTVHPSIFVFIFLLRLTSCCWFISPPPPVPLSTHPRVKFCQTDRMMTIIVYDHRIKRVHRVANIVNLGGKEKKKLIHGPATFYLFIFFFITGPGPFDYSPGFLQ